MIEHVYERVRRSSAVSRVLVATDDERIARVVRGFGGEALMTRNDHATGTDRVAEAAHSVEADIIVNVQGDEPLLDPRGIGPAVQPLLDERALEMSTLSLPLTDLGEMLSPSVVKVVTDARGNALYFSRSPIPHVRQTSLDDVREAAADAVTRGLARKHVGLYAYRRSALAHLAALPPSPLEEAEGLEQLRALHHGFRIRVVPVEGEATVAVDTPADLERVRTLMMSTTQEGRT
jgi:3-deoxy-manno-octulosonate cytidylyltransferase (CMP-KDO synthetase)